MFHNLHVLTAIITILFTIEKILELLKTLIPQMKTQPDNVGIILGNAIRTALKMDNQNVAK